MSDGESFVLERMDALRIDRPDALRGFDLMSPYVWREDKGQLGLMLRAVPVAADADASTGSIWYGTGTDGLCFRLEDRPVLVPGPDAHDAKGCEDPTVVRHAGQLIVFYSGLDAEGNGHLLWASGPDARSLTKRGIAHRSFHDEQDVKEAEVAITRNGHWTMGFEYARGEASMIGYAEGDGPAGPWRPTKHDFGARADKFDSWHLSPGPMLLDDPERPIMFYNGATHDGVWGVGWVVFDHANARVIDRCDAPLIAPPGEVDGRNMAFAASMITHRDSIHLYLSLNDRSCQRAIIRRGRAREDAR